MSDLHHDLGNKVSNLTITVDRSEFQPSSVNPSKVVATRQIPHDHLSQIIGCSSVDFLGVKGAHIEGISPLKAEGLPTGAVLGMVSGHTDSDGVFTPLQTDKSTSHIDTNGDVNIYSATFTGRNGVPSHDKLMYNYPADVSYADPTGVLNKTERWAGVEPEDAHQGFSMFTGTNMNGDAKQKAAVRKGSALHRLLEVNKDSSKFRRTVGEIREITHSDMGEESEYSVIDAGTASSLADGLKEALTRKGPLIGSGEATIKLIADRDVVAAGSCPISASFNIHRADETKAIPRGSAAGLPASALSSGISGTASSLAQRVFEDEKGVVSIKEGGAGSD